MNKINNLFNILNFNKFLDKNKEHRELIEELDKIKLSLQLLDFSNCSELIELIKKQVRKELK